MKGNPVLYKTLVIGVIVLFICAGIQPSVAVQTETEIDIEPKDYLFQTIIDFANNPDVKELLERSDNDLFKIDIDRSIHRKLFLRNPRLMFNTLFTKPSLSVEYLNKCYNNGIRITNIIGEDKLIETIENVEVTDTKLFDELNDIISKDEELSGRFETLKRINKEFILDYEYPIICLILWLIWLPIGFVGTLMSFLLFRELENNPFLFIIIAGFYITINIIGWILFLLFYSFDCYIWPNYLT